MDYWVIFEKAGDGSYSAYVPDLPGCVSCGDSFEEARQMIAEAITLHVAEMRKRGLPIPPATSRAAVVHADAA